MSWSEIRAIFRTRALQHALWITIGVSMWLAVGIGIVAWVAIDAMTRAQLRSLASEVKTFQHIAHRSGTARLVETLQSRSDPHLRVRLVSAGGQTLVGQATLEPYDDTKPGHPATAVYQAVSASGQADTFLGIAVALPDGGRLILARPMRNLSALTGGLGWFLSLGLLLFAAVTFSAAYSTMRRMQQRTTRLQSECEQVMQGNLSRRLTVTDEGDEIDRIAAQVNDMLDRIERLMASLREVSDNVAHDLRTPLNRLRLRAESALTRAENDAELRDGLAGAIDDADELLRTLNAMLLVAGLEAGRRPREEEQFDVSEMLMDLGDLYQPVAEDQGAMLEVHSAGEIFVQANRGLISRAVVNLIENALKYGKPAPAPEASFLVSINADQAARRHLTIDVADRGAGVPEADRKRVLDRFVRLDESRGQPGTGLGLSLVAAIARAYGGSFTLMDNGPGLRARLVLPILNDSSHQHRPERAEPRFSNHQVHDGELPAQTGAPRFDEARSNTSASKRLLERSGS